jgi:hypothetical protein
MGTFRDVDIDSISSLIFSPDPLLRHQYARLYEAKSSVYHSEALRKLMLAVLEDGIACFQTYFYKPSRKNEKLFNEAEEWIASDSDDLFSFSNVCENLGINSKWLRQELFGWKERQTRKAAENRKRMAVQSNKSSSTSYRPSKHGP